MKKQPKIKLSIVIVNFNTRDLLAKCLLSLPRCDVFKIIVVDNASTDGSAAMVRKDFPKVTLLASRTNDGYAKNNNKARKVAEGEYVLFLNSDTEVYSGTGEAMADYMDRNSEVGIATCLTILPDGSLYYACHRGFPTLWNSLCYFLGLARMFPKVKLFAGYTATYLPIDKIHEIDACSGTFLMIRKNLLDEVGWFDEDYFAFGEDIEMCYRVKELGYKVMFNPTVSILHHWGASSGLKSTSKMVTTARLENSQRWNWARYQAMKLFYNKHYRRKYPELVHGLVFFAIGLAGRLRGGRD